MELSIWRGNIGAARQGIRRLALALPRRRAFDQMSDKINSRMLVALTDGGGTMGSEHDGTVATWPWCM